MRWVTLNGYQGHWVAMDDAIDELPEDLEQLVACDKLTGLTIEKLKHETL